MQLRIPYTIMHICNPAQAMPIPYHLVQYRRESERAEEAMSNLNNSNSQIFLKSLENPKFRLMTLRKIIIQTLRKRIDILMIISMY